MRKGDIAIIILVIFVVAMIVGLYFFVTGNSKDCLANPIKYFEKEAGASCSCYNEEGKRFDFGESEVIEVGGIG